MKRHEVFIGMKAKIIYPRMSGVLGTEVAITAIAEDNLDNTVVEAVVIKVLHGSQFKVGQTIGRYIWKLEPVKNRFKDWAKRMDERNSHA